MADQLDEQIRVTVQAVPETAEMEDIGNYRVLRLLGKGGMGAVYEVEHKLLKQRYALKILSPDRIPDIQVIERFRAEAKAISGLHHDSLLRIYEFGISDKGQPFFVTDLFEGDPLSTAIKTRGELKTDAIIQIMTQCISALSHAHEKGIIHRDIKPSNILIRETGGITEAKIIDFGIAKQQQSEDGSTPATLTATGELIGTPQYMSPEQCQGQKLDARSDIYSLGCVLYQMLTGQPPFDSANFMTLMLAHLNNSPKEIRAKDKVRKSLAAIAMRCLAKNPESRYRSMDDLFAAVEAASAGTTIRHQKFHSKQTSFRQRLKIYIPTAILAMLATFMAVSYNYWAPGVVLYMHIPLMDRGQAEEIAAVNEWDRLRADALRIDGSLDMDKLQYAEDMMRRHAVGSKPWNIDAANHLAAILAIEGKYDAMQSIINDMSGHVPLNIAQNLHSTATALDHGGFHAQAWPLMSKAHKMWKKLVGENDPRTIKELFNMGAADYNAGNKRRALNEFKAVLPKLKYLNPKLEPQVQSIINEIQQ